MNTRPAVALAALLVLSACGDTVSKDPPKKSEATWTELKDASLTDAQKAQRAKADGAKNRIRLFGDWIAIRKIRNGFWINSIFISGL